jgi:hypothetical protein
VPKLSLQVSDRVRFKRFLVSLDLLFFLAHNDLLSTIILEKGIHPTRHGLRQSHAVLLQPLPRWCRRSYGSNDIITILKIRDVFRVLTMVEIRCGLDGMSEAKRTYNIGCCQGLSKGRARDLVVRVARSASHVGDK